MHIYVLPMIRGRLMKLTSKSRGSRNICVEPLIQLATLWIFSSQRSRDAAAAKRFFHKTLKAIHTQTPRVITMDKNAAYPKAINELKVDKELPKKVKLRQKKYLNNIVEQDH